MSPGPPTANEIMHDLFIIEFNKWSCSPTHFWRKWQQIWELYANITTHQDKKMNQGSEGKKSHQKWHIPQMYLWKFWA